MSSGPEACQRRFCVSFWAHVSSLIILTFFPNLVISPVIEIQSEQPIRVRTALVNVPVVVSNRNGQKIVGLKKEDFFISQGTEQLDVEFFEDVETPMIAAVLIDSSMSALHSIETIKKSAKLFLKTFGSADLGMIASFDYDVNILTEPTSNKNKLKNGIDKVSITKIPIEDAPRGQTKLWDAVYRVISKEFSKVKGRKAVVILSDGFEAGTSISFEKLSETLADSDTVVYAVLFPTPSLSGYLPSGTKTITRDQLFSLPCIREIKTMTDDTGGAIYLSGTDDLTIAFQSISDELRRQYVVGFYPVTGNGLKNISVRVKRTDAVVRTKKMIRVKTTSPPRN